MTSTGEHDVSQHNSAVAELPLLQHGAHQGRELKLQKRRADEAGSDPFRLARAYLDAEGRDDQGRITVRFWRGEWYRYRDGRYAPASDSTISVDLTGFIKTYFDENIITDRWGNVLRVGKGLVRNAVNALSAMVVIPDDAEVPVWLSDDVEGPFIAVSNGLLDIGNLRDSSTVDVRENSPLWFSTVVLPVSYERGARSKRWSAFLEEIMEGDYERIEFIQEWSGYLLTADTTQQKFVMAEGEGANGKSVLLDVLTSLLGPENVAHVPLEMFGHRFQLTATLGKLANICAEVGQIDRVAEGFLKQFTAGDRMYFDRKNIAAMHAYPTARLILSTNNRPRFRDRSNGLWRRMILLPFSVTIARERQDPLLKEKLKEELPGILLWALDGLRRLQHRGHFVIPVVCADALKDYQQESNPARVFLDENYIEDTNRSVACSPVYEKYTTWCSDNGFEVLDSRQFGKEVRKAFPKVERVKVGRARHREWSYRGLTHVPSCPMSSNQTNFGEQENGMSANQ
jgi:putative DNA primase/helicase